MQFNVYIDGSWLFKQCAPHQIFANRMEFPDGRFKLDFTRLISLLGDELSNRVIEAGISRNRVAPAALYFYIAAFDVPDDPDPDWGDVEDIRRSSDARKRFAEEAVAAGFSSEGVFTVPLRGWIVERYRERRYQEKMVDTSLVGRLVEQAIADGERFHVLISGDLDMLPAIRTVVPDYTETVILAATHPDQYHRAEAQSSYVLSQFRLRFDPIYLENHVEKIVGGEYVYRCHNRECFRVFVRSRPVPEGSNPVCKPCHDLRYA